MKKKRITKKEMNEIIKDIRWGLQTIVTTSGMVKKQLVILDRGLTDRRTRLGKK